MTLLRREQPRKFWSPRPLYHLLWHNRVQSRLQQVPILRRIYAGWLRTHPFDRSHGVDTSGFAPPHPCKENPALKGKIQAYGGSQPSIIRRSLDLLPNPSQYHFLDIGCGKGRPLMVASSYPFRSLVGLEISPGLAGVARANAALLGRRNPLIPPIRIEVGDATKAQLPGPAAVCFFYHAFGAELIEAMLNGFVAQLDAPLDRTDAGQGDGDRLQRQKLEYLLLIYYNPVHAFVLDRHARFERWSAAVHAYADEELGYGPTLEDAVVIWQSRPSRLAPLEGCNRAVVSQGNQAALVG